MSYIKEAVQIGPNMARQFLAKNHPNNRKPKENKIRSYAADMKAGLWVYPTGEQVKFDDEGFMIDGQNRMEAVILAETSVLFDVIYDLPSKAKYVLDSGAGRSYADALAFQGVANRNNVGAVVRWIMAWERGFPRISGGHVQPTHGEMEIRRTQEPLEFEASTLRGLDVSRQKVTNAAAAGTAHFLLSHIDKEQAEMFFDELVSSVPSQGDPMRWEPGHPVLELRNRLIRGSKRDSRQDKLALIIRGWNAWREGRKLGQVILTTDPKGLTNENFPKPR